MEHVELIGRVVHGKKLGRELGAPTLNFDSKPEGFPFGVYIGETVLMRDEQKKYSSIAHWGPRPTFEEEEPILEVHLLDFSEDLYGEEVRFVFLKKLREVKSFESAEALKIQIQNDLEQTRAFFA